MAKEARAADVPGSQPLSALLIRGQLQRVAEEYERLLAQNHDLLQQNSALRESLEVPLQIPRVNKIDAFREPSKESSYWLSEESRSRSKTSREVSKDFPQADFAQEKCSQRPCADIPDPLADICLSEHHALNVVDLDTTLPMNSEAGSGGSLLQTLTNPSRQRNGQNLYECKLDMEILPPLNDEKSIQVLDIDQGLSMEQDSEGEPGSPLPLHISEGNKTNTCSTLGEGGFPRWFDPGSEGEELRMSTAEPSFDIRNSSLAETAPDCGTVEPLGKIRLSWDMIAFLCLLFELWATPFELIYLETAGTPVGLKVTSYCSTAFFAIDILLNFNTGYIDGDRTIMNRRSIIKNYIKFWFWVDVIATMPFDLLVQTVSGSMFSMARVGKASKVLKTLRYLKMVRAFRLFKTMQQAGNVTRHLQILNFLRFLVGPAQVLTFLLLFAHTHGCIWALLQPSIVDDATTAHEAFVCYFQSFAWAFLAVTGGTLGEGTEGESLAVLALGMAIACERLMILVLGSQKVIFHVLCLIDNARKVHAQKNVVKFLRDHKVSFQTQIQVLFNMTDTSTAQKHQEFFDRLWNSALPRDLRRDIAYELWVDRLLSLGLIAQVAKWNAEFIVELALSTTQKVFPSRVILFSISEPALEAYFIIQGELKALRHCGSSDNVMIFTKGMWVGENALASSRLRYSATFLTKNVTSLMVVKGESFQELISRFHLMTQFEGFCSSQLWKGLCGRCGSIGNHFSDTCCEPKNALENKHALQLEKAPVKLTPAPVTGLTWPQSAALAAVQADDTGDDAFDSESGSSRSFKPSQRLSLGVGTSRRHSIDSNQSQSSLLDQIVAKLPWQKATAEAPTEPETSLTPHTGGDLKRLLKEKGLLRILPSLRNMGVHDLDRLEAISTEAVKCQLAIEGFDLSEEEQQALTPEHIQEFRKVNSKRVHSLLFQKVSRLHHLIFLSHYKVEAGTEAALMRTELEQAIAANPGSLGHSFDEPVFLDSDNLQNLEDLVQRVRNTHNLVLLLTQHVLSRPWVLVEMITAKREGVRVIPVTVSKPGSNFVFPDDPFYERLRDGSYIGEEGVEVLTRCGYTLESAEEAVRHAFQQIAVPYSPHKATGIRRAEINALLKSSRLKSDDRPVAEALTPRMGSRSMSNWWDNAEPASPTSPFWRRRSGSFAMFN